MDQLTLEGKKAPFYIGMRRPNIIAIYGDWGYEEDPVTGEEIYVTVIEDVRVFHCEYAEFIPNRNRCQGGCDSDSKGGVGYCIKLGTKMSILGQPWRVVFE